MEVGLALPQFDFSVAGESPLRWATVVEWATRADAAGFAHVWMADHLFLEVEKYGGPPGRFDAFDPFVGLAALARVTTRVRLGTLVLCAQLRRPGITGKMLATLDDLSGGRVIAGVGAGWYEPEYAAAGIPFERPGVRVQQLEDTVIALKGSLTTPVWVGGRGDKVMEVAARHADGFNHGGWNDKAPPRRLDAFWATCERVGRDPATITLAVNHTVGDPAALADELGAFEEEGATTVIVGLGQLPFSVTTFDALDRVASYLP
ncbi:MAG TPA: LLM class flavin-dependent oxidoreductase [Acidimicrobiales bacterium]|nr:LLM class flavin-dependent oxidoreductase [Acidimicrobiales bacterium]